LVIFIIRIKLFKPKRKFFRIQPRNCPKVFKFKSNEKDKKDVSEWFTLVKMHYMESEGNKRILTSLIKFKRFWRVKAL
jgi:hypothetical protein